MSRVPLMSQYNTGPIGFEYVFLGGYGDGPYLEKASIIEDPNASESSPESVTGISIKGTGWSKLRITGITHTIGDTDAANKKYVDDKFTDNALTTTTKNIVSAINEVNALAKGYSTIFTPIELTTETAQNKTAIDARVAAFTAQGISLTNGCCIPVTYKGVYAGNISLINGDWYGLLVKNTNNPADNINIKLSADGTITEGNSAQ